MYRSLGRLICAIYLRLFPLSPSLLAFAQTSPPFPQVWFALLWGGAVKTFCWCGAVLNFFQSLSLDFEDLLGVKQLSDSDRR